MDAIKVQVTSSQQAIHLHTPAKLYAMLEMDAGRCTRSVRPFVQGILMQGRQCEIGCVYLPINSILVTEESHER